MLVCHTRLYIQADLIWFPTANPINVRRITTYKPPGSDRVVQPDRRSTAAKVGSSSSVEGRKQCASGASVGLCAHTAVGVPGTKILAAHSKKNNIVVVLAGRTTARTGRTCVH